MIGNARKRPVDPVYQLPLNRRGFWAPAQDLAVFLSTSVLLNVLFALSVLGMGAWLVYYYNQPPPVLTQDQGSLFYRTTEVFKLRTDVIQRFLEVTLEDLNSLNEIHDTETLKKFASEDLIQRFTEECKEKYRLGQKQVFQINELKRYFDPNDETHIIVAAKGKWIDERQLNWKPSEKDTVVLLAYMSQEIPSAQNSWGLKLVKLTEIKNPQQASEVWQGDYCVPLEGSKDLNERPILKPREEFLPKG